MHLRRRSIAAAPGRWRLADEATKEAGQVRLVGHAAVERDLGQRRIAFEQDSLCLLDPAHDDVGVRRTAQAGLEGAREIGVAEPHEAGERTDR